MPAIFALSWVLKIYWVSTSMEHVNHNYFWRYSIIPHSPFIHDCHKYLLYNTVNVSCIIILSLFCFLWLVKGRLIITLEEPSAENNILIQVGDSATNQSKRINLVPGRTFHLHCCEARSEENGCDGNNLLTTVWYSGNDEVPAVSSDSDPDHRPMVYTYLENNQRTLVLTNFTLANVGIYKCRERGAGNTEGADVVIGASEQMYT